MYDFGLGVAVDYEEAARWYRKAAERGDAECQYHLGLMYEFGTGVPQDIVLARVWFTLSAAQGDSAASRKALELRRELEEDMTSDQIDEAGRFGSFDDTGSWIPPHARSSRRRGVSKIDLRRGRGVVYRFQFARPFCNETVTTHVPYGGVK
jgi:TPR repeat protein